MVGDYTLNKEKLFYNDIQTTGDHVFDDYWDQVKNWARLFEYFWQCIIGAVGRCQLCRIFLDIQYLIFFWTSNLAVNSIVDTIILGLLGHSENLVLKWVQELS